MYDKYLPLVCLVAACSSDMEPPVADPCAVKPVVAGGTAELGLGSAFMPVSDGQDVEVQLGIQGLWMFVVNARARDMDVGSGDREGVVDLTALDQNGAQVSLAVGCRVREFAQTNDGHLELTSAFLLPLLPSVTPVLDGAAITIHLEIRDDEGHRATDERSVVAHLPVQGR